MNKKHSANLVYIDTNVLINVDHGTQTDKECLKYLFNHESTKLYTSSLVVAQFIASMQNKKTERKSKSEIVNSIVSLMHNVSVLSCTESDIKNALDMQEPDIEDNLQYCISQKKRCDYVITNNVKDYRRYPEITAVKPSNVRMAIRKK